MGKVETRRVLASILCMLMLVTAVFTGSNLTAKAVGASGLHFNEADLAKATITYQLGGATPVEVTAENLNVTGIADGTIIIKVKPKSGSNITGVQANEGSETESPAYQGNHGGDATEGYTFTFTSNSQEYYVKLNEGSQGPQGKTLINFGGGSWTVGEVTVTADRNGTIELDSNDEIRLTNFNAGTMEVRLSASDGFNTTLNVVDGVTKLANKTNGGGLPNNLTFTVQAKGGSGSNNPGGNSGNNPGGEPNVFVETSQPEMIGEVKIEDRGVNWNDERTSGGAQVPAAPSYKLTVQLEFGKSASSITVNGTKYTGESANVTVEGPEGDRFIFTNMVPNAEGKFILSFEETESIISTIVWTYDEKDPAGPQGDTFSEDALVKHGKVEIVSIKRGDKVLYENGDYTNGVNPETDKISVDIEGKRGHVRLEKGDDIVIKLIPEYGYQLGSASINDRALTPKSKDFSDVSTFTLDDVQGQMHFSGVFVKKDDTITNKSEAITSANIADGENAAESGNLSLKVEDAKADAVALSKAQGKDTAANLEAVATLDLTLDNVVSMGPGKENWTKNITEFSNDIIVKLNLSDITVGDDEELIVVRKHGDAYDVLEGVKLEKGTLSVPTNKFSTYSVLKKTSDKKENNKEDSNKEDVVNNVVVSTSKQKDNFGAGQLASSSKEILDAVLTAEDKAAIESGKKVDVWITVKDISSTISSTEKALVENKVPDNYNVGVYLDIDLLKQIEGNDSVKVKELPNGKIKISVAVPDTLKKEGRAYKVIRIHEGVATVLDASVNASGELTFETDRFSVYTIIYSDENVTATPATTPNTGDNSNLIQWLIMMLGGVVVLTLVAVMRWKKLVKLV